MYFQELRVKLQVKYSVELFNRQKKEYNEPIKC